MKYPEIPHRSDVFYKVDVEKIRGKMSGPKKVYLEKHMYEVAYRTEEGKVATKEQLITPIGLDYWYV